MYRYAVLFQAEQISDKLGYPAPPAKFVCGSFLTVLQHRSVTARTYDGISANTTDCRSSMKGIRCQMTGCASTFIISRLTTTCTCTLRTCSWT